MAQFFKLTNKQFSISNKKNGFTFIETIIAFFVITIGILGVFVVAQHPIFYTTHSISRLTAAYLAQEGIEIVRNLRDENWLKEDANWYDGLVCYTPPCEYQADYHNSSLDPYSGNLLKFDSAEGYNYSSGADTKFTRKITIDDTPMPEFLMVSVLVQWEEKGKSYEIPVQENLYDWWQQTP